jgi:hypothetical protein
MYKNNMSYRGIVFKFHTEMKYLNKTMVQLYDFEVSNLRSCDILFVFQISIPMSVEFEELAKLRDNPSDEQASKYLLCLFLMTVLVFWWTWGSRCSCLSIVCSREATSLNTFHISLELLLPLAPLYFPVFPCCHVTIHFT